jgi:hypothetical protein
MPDLSITAPIRVNLIKAAQHASVLATWDDVDRPPYRAMI